MWIMTEQGWGWMQPKVVVRAERSGIFRPDSIGMAEFECERRCLDYRRNVQLYLAEQIELEAIYRDWAEPMYGAFGERLR